VWRCDFCPMSKFNGRTRMYSPKYIVDYIDYLVERYNHRELVFGDNTLTWWREHSVELFQRLIERNHGLEWICMTRADMVDPELLGMMYAAGCREISYGIESGSETVHKTIKKKLRLHKVKDAFAQVHAAGINSTCMLMVANRGETRDTLRETTGLVREVDPDRILIWTTKVYPGTVLHDIAKEQGVIPPGYYDDDFAPAPYYTGEHTETELRRLESMLQHRGVWVDAAPSVPFADIDRGLRLSAWRADGATVLGGAEAEVLSRPDIFEILARAKQVEVKQVHVHTSGHGFVSQKFTEKARLACVIREIHVPIWSMQERHHDLRVGTPGALRETRKGILRWTQDPSPVRAMMMVDRYDLGNIRPWVRWLKEHRVTDAVLVYGETLTGWNRLPAADVPGLSEMSEAVSAASEEAAAVGLGLTVSGLPRCLVPIDIDIFEQNRPFDEMVTREGEPYNLAVHRRDTRKEFAPACAGCALRGQCEGLWIDVARARGTHELRPVLEPDAAHTAAK
jgi:MoaA/NifB/PqqE/SkfB family radical SAM enzyme